MFKSRLKKLNLLHVTQRICLGNYSPKQGIKFKTVRDSTMDM